MGARALRKVVVSAALVAALAAAAACDKTANRLLDLDPDDDEVSSATLFVEPLFLTFEHVVQASPCPQLVGKILFRNLGSSDRVVLVATDPPLFAEAQTATIARGGVVELEIYFDCSIRTSFVGKVRVTDPSGAAVGEVLVEGNIDDVL